MNLYLLQYNNYYNRLVKREEGISAYLPYVIYGPRENDEYMLTEIENFYEADGVNTRQVVNTPTANFDYLVAVDEYGVIHSRWFVIEAMKNTFGQYELSLHRDLLADYYDFTINSPCYVERAIVNSSNKFIYNSENMMFNQIKKSEILLADRSRCPWIVGYIADNAFIDETDVDANGNVTGVTRDLVIESTLDGQQVEESISNATESRFSKSDLESWSSIDCGCISRTTYVAEGLNASALVPISMYGFKFGDETESYKVDIDKDLNILWGSYYISDSNRHGVAQAMTDAFNVNPSIRANAHTAISVAHSISDKFFSYEDLQWLLNNQNRVLVDDNGSYFSIVVESTGTKELSTPITASSGAAFVDVMNIISRYITGDADLDPETKGIALYVDYTKIKINIKSILTTSFTTTIKSSVRKLIDAPYRMFAIPCPLNGAPRAGAATFRGQYTDGQGVLQDTIGSCEPNAEASMNLAMDIARKLGSKLYDLQLLPYNPLTDIKYGYFQTTPTSHSKKHLQLRDYLSFDYTTGRVIAEETDQTIVSPAVMVDDNSGVVGINYKVATYVMWAKTSNFSFTIRNVPEQGDPDTYAPLPAVPFVSVPTDSTEFKVEHETSFYRLVSPNYNGTFEFKATSNQGIDYFEVDATYKPYSPYIKISPNFGGLYGGDFDDARGLILGGDFSLPTLTDAWEQYQINNKSYRESFNNQITNMEKTYDIQRAQQKEAAGWSAVAAGISGAGTGAMMGSLAGPVGAGVGAAVGASAAAVSAIGASKDLMYADQLHDQAVSFAKEQFNLSLQNIAALPYSLNKVSAFDKNNKYFPFLEYYSCTDEEKNALRQKLKYTSMTINAIGNVAQYIQENPTFIQAQLIRMEGYTDEITGDFVEFHEDYHITTAIAAELHKGIYV